MARSRSVIVAGAGIGGLTAALALARVGFRVVILEQARILDETGAGIQLSPNATRILDGLGLLDRIAALAVTPDFLRVLTSRGREITRMPLGRVAEFFYGAPYLTIHRGDLQAALVAAVQAEPDITLRLDSRVDDFAVHSKGITAQIRHTSGNTDEHGIALIAADGLWSALRERIGHQRPPRFYQRTAWRATVDAGDVAAPLRESVISLWLGRHAHLVHYPVSGGRRVNIVAIVHDEWSEVGWSSAGARDEIVSRFTRWAPGARSIIAAPKNWLKWALCDQQPLRQWGEGPVTILGDAAHPMLPFLAQGAASAIEDAHVLAQCLGESPEEPAAALRRYESERVARTARLQQAAIRNRRVYAHWGINGFLRNIALRAIGGEGLMRQYDWIYDWRPRAPLKPVE